MSQTGDPDFPADVFPALDVPGIGQTRRFYNAAGKGSPELGPLFHVSGLGRQTTGSKKSNQKDGEVFAEVHLTDF
jgi:hypothetical protein